MSRSNESRKPRAEAKVRDLSEENARLRTENANLQDQLSSKVANFDDVTALASERESRLQAERALEVACRAGRHDTITISERDAANALLEKQLSEEKAARLRAERERDLKQTQIGEHKAFVQRLLEAAGLCDPETEEEAVEAIASLLESHEALATAERERDEARAINAAWERAALGAFGEGTTPANLLEGGQGMEQAVHDSDAGLAAAQKRIEGLEKWLSERATYFDDDAKELRAEASKLRKRGEEADSMFRLGCADYATGFARELRAALSSPAVTTGDEIKTLSGKGTGRD